MDIVPPSTKRACGERKPGGIYIEVGLGGSLTIEQAMFDPPLPADGVILELPGGDFITADRLSARGQVVARFPNDSTWHVWDVVGAGDYPYPVDFLEEVRTEGLSRRSPQTLRFDLLGQGSRIFLLHERGWLENPQDYYARLPGFACPKGINHPGGEPCAGLWWCDVAEADSRPVEALRFQGQPARKRTIGARTYRCAARPPGVTPRHARAVIASFAIWRLAVVRDQANAAAARQQAERAKLPVALVEE